MKKLVLVLGIAALCNACVSTQGRYKLISYDKSGGTAVGTEKVSAESCKRSVTIVNYEDGGTEEDAIRAAIAKSSGANALADVKVTKKSLYTFFFNFKCYTAEGIAVKL